MAIVCWDGSLKIGVDAIDAQHRYLFEIINNMQGKLATGHPREALLDGLDSMRTYARFHFETEEALLERHGYPEREHHRQAHQEFLEALERLSGQPASTELAHQALGFLLSWLAGHIQSEDGRYAPFLAEHGMN
ncbi:MAG: hemerythrin family protein [Proteobacteria bacterium]|nr:hemerythrin family protein [Pseudomonadota bacterium]